MWIYHQHSGELVRSGKAEKEGEGYSGSGVAGMNNVSAQAIPYVGPIPRGLYEISLRGPAHDPKLKNMVLKLRPIGHDALKRPGLLIHGEGEKDMGMASWGCIVLPLEQREGINKSGDNLFWVDF